MIKFPAFKIADYRKLWAGAAFNHQGQSGEQVVLGLLVFEATQSTAWVGVILAAYFLPFFIFGMASGAVADRLDRRSLLRRIEVLIIINMTLFAAALAMGYASHGLLIVFALIAGGLRALHQPARVSYAYDIVGGDHIVSSLGLLNLAGRTGQLIGALAAGAVMAKFGASTALLALAAGHGIALCFFLQLREPGTFAAVQRVPLGQNLREYAQELRGNHILLMLVAITALVEIFGFSFATALPELATTRLNMGAEGLGLLHAARATGGIIAGLGLSLLGALQRRGLAYIGVIVAFAASLMMLSAETTLEFTVCAVILVSGAATASDVLTQSMMQLAVPNALRGRAMGVWVLAIGFAPVGHLEMGALASTIGVGDALLVNGAALLAIGLVVIFAAPRLRTL
ncbi:MAG: MFS transporter [Alphaproteobacteria bacterium]|nr:MFS transporter [Alphaproteobacteria bacterium]